MKKILSALFICLGFLSCAPQNSSNDDKVHITAAANMEAEQLSLAGEQLLSPHSFMLADKVFDMALAKDPTNIRARFYKELLRPQMLTSGFVARSRNFFNALGEQDKLVNIFLNIPNSSFKDFLLNGPSDLDTETQMQDFLVQYRNSLFDLYTFLKQTEKTELVINLNPLLFFSPIRDDYQSSCVVNVNTADKVDVVCDYRSAAQRKVNQADMIALRQIVGGAFLYTSIYTNYSVEGASKIYLAAHNKDVNPSQVMDMIRQTPTLGNLRRDHVWAKLSSLGADLSSSWKYAMDNHSTLCPARKWEIGKIRKSYLFDNGICVDVDGEAQKNFALFNDALNGPVQVKVKNSISETKDVTVNPFLMAKQPIKDLKNILPTEFNDCKKPIAWADPTFGGTIINPDPAFMFKTSCEKFHE